MDNIIEVCPKCGSDLSSMTLLCDPPIYKKKCTNPDCCWSWEYQPNVVRVTFNEDKQ